MPDMEAIEVAQEALSDVSENESSEVVVDETLEQPEAEDADGEVSEKESKSQRRRRMRRDREEQANQQISWLEQENTRLRERAKSIKAPNPENYTSEYEYTADLAAYKVRQQDVQAESERIQTSYSEAESDDGRGFNDSIADFNAEGAEKFKDFDQVVRRMPADGGPVLTAIMAEALMETDLGVDIAYYLGNNVKESQKIANLSPVAQAKAIFNLEAKVAKANMPAQSQAPAPVKPVRGGSASPSKPVSQMSMSEYAAYRQKQMSGAS